ncbi:HNH endonuclease [uncultured Jatrophihabitans sp.]|uniref:HNH endonuclease n=1 Tax=uncultured Jatrophihabitans sp. TaxID=1610747 RepID=UPI0035C94493
MADTLVERITGQATADAVPVEIELIMTDTSLFGPSTHGDDTHTDISDDETTEAAGAAEADEPALLVGFGPIPAGLAREIALGTLDKSADDTARRQIRRLFLHPATGQLAAMESTSRLFTTNQRRFIRFRDQGHCRTPWCDAPIRHTDHVKPHSQGGQTHTDNGAGACQACNHAKQAPGWTTQPAPDGSIITTTPTGHQYRSQLPDPPGTAPRAPDLDQRLTALQQRGRLAA